MKRKALIFALIFSLILSICAVTAFGAEESGEILPFSESEEIVPVNPELEYGDEDLWAVFDELYGEDSGLVMFSIFGMIFSIILFFPSLVLMIVFIVMNRKTKKEIREYENIYGGLPVSYPNPAFNQSQYNMTMGSFNPQPIQSPPQPQQEVNPSGVPFGTKPMGENKVQESDFGQGGQL